MIIRNERPPNYDAIAARFPIRGKRGVIFAYGDAIYNPDQVAIPQHLIVHEEMHGWRQERHAGGAEGWWQDYIDNDRFRLEEEILAHQVEYRELMKGTAPRHVRRASLHQVAKRLAQPMYDFDMSLNSARKLVRAAA